MRVCVEKRCVLVWNKSKCAFTGWRVRVKLRSITKEANVYRLELTGMYSGFDFIISMCSLHGVMDSRVKVGCDNEKALLLFYEKVQRVCHKRNHVEIL